MVFVPSLDSILYLEKFKQIELWNTFNSRKGLEKEKNEIENTQKGIFRWFSFICSFIMFSDFFIDSNYIMKSLPQFNSHNFLFTRRVCMCIGLVSARPSTEFSEMFYLHFERAFESTSKQVWDEWENITKINRKSLWKFNFVSIKLINILRTRIEFHRKLSYFIESLIQRVRTLLSSRFSANSVPHHSLNHSWHHVIACVNWARLDELKLKALHCVGVYG